MNLLIFQNVSAIIDFRTLSGIHFWGFVKFLLYVIFVDMVRFCYEEHTDPHPHVMLIIISPGGSWLGYRHSALVGQQHLPP